MNKEDEKLINSVYIQTNCSSFVNVQNEVQRLGIFDNIHHPLVLLRTLIGSGKSQ